MKTYFQYKPEDDVEMEDDFYSDDDLDFDHVQEILEDLGRFDLCVGLSKINIERKQ